MDKLILINPFQIDTNLKMIQCRVRLFQYQVIFIWHLNCTFCLLNIEELMELIAIIKYLVIYGFSFFSLLLLGSYLASKFKKKKPKSKKHIVKSNSSIKNYTNNYQKEVRYPKPVKLDLKYVTDEEFGHYSIDNIDKEDFKDRNNNKNKSSSKSDERYSILNDRYESVENNHFEYDERRKVAYFYNN